jgi:hypothetical protein
MKRLHITLFYRATLLTTQPSAHQLSTPVTLRYFPTSASTALFKSALNPSHPFRVFSFIPALLAIAPSPYNPPSKPENTSSCVNVVPPGVVCDGVQWNECVPVNMRGRLPVQEKRVGVFV